MKNVINRLATGCFVTLAASMLIVSCQKTNDAKAPLTLNNERASVPTQAADTIWGNYANPAGGPGGFGTVYWNVITGAQDHSGSITHNLQFSSYNNGNLSKSNSNDTLRYLNTSTALGSIAISDYNSATPITTYLGQNTATNAANTSYGANGFWNYDDILHTATNTQNVVIFFRAQGSSSIYAFKFNNVWGEGPPSLNRGVYALRRGEVN
jgi:hypothetical protein